MAPNLPPKSPRMTSPQLHQEHAVIPIIQPQQDISIDKHGENGREVGGIVYHPLGKGSGKGLPMKERNRVNEGMGWTGYISKDNDVPGSASDGKYHLPNVPTQSQPGGGYKREEGDHGLNLQRQPHRDTQETGPSPLPAARTVQHHSSANHHHSSQNPQPLVNLSAGPRLSPTPDNSSPPTLQVRSLNTPSKNQTGHGNPMDEVSHSRSKGEGRSGINEQGGEGIVNRFKTTFLAKNKGPMSKTWARKSYLDELESMAPTSPPLTSPREFRSAPITPLDHGEGRDLESGQREMRRIT